MQNRDRLRLSRLRQALVQMIDEPGKLLRLFLDDRPIVKGSVYILKRRCGKSTCRCQSGMLHKSPVLTASIDGCTRLQSIAGDRLEELRELTGRYQRFRKGRADFIKFYIKMVGMIDAIERIRRRGP